MSYGSTLNKNLGPEISYPVDCNSYPGLPGYEPKCTHCIVLYGKLSVNFLIFVCGIWCTKTSYCQCMSVHSFLLIRPWIPGCY